MFKLKQINSNPNNPRLIKDDKFEKLVNSILVFPEMMLQRPIVIDTFCIALGGNMRDRGCKAISDLGYERTSSKLKELSEKYGRDLSANIKLLGPLFNGVYPDGWVSKVDWNEAQKAEFVIKDNAGFGEWDMDILANEWDSLLLSDWGVDVWQDIPEIEEEPVNSGSKNLTVTIECENLTEQIETYKKLCDLGYVVKKI